MTGSVPPVSGAGAAERARRMQRQALAMRQNIARRKAWQAAQREKPCGNPLTKPSGHREMDSESSKEC